jgi:hypothetical protein
MIFSSLLSFQSPSIYVPFSWREIKLHPRIKLCFSIFKFYCLRGRRKILFDCEYSVAKQICKLLVTIVVYFALKQHNKKTRSESNASAWPNAINVHPRYQRQVYDV